MSFLNAVGKVAWGVTKFTGEMAVGIGKEILNTSKEASSLKDDYDSKDDEYLESKRKSGTTAEKLASNSVLKNRK